MSEIEQRVERLERIAHSQSYKPTDATEPQIQGDLRAILTALREKEAECEKQKVRLQELWTERRQILQDAGSEEIGLIKRAEAAEARASALQARLEGMVEACKPFVAAITELDDTPADFLAPEDMPIGDALWEHSQPIVGHFRKLRAAYDAALNGGAK